MPRTANKKKRYMNYLQEVCAAANNNTKVTSSGLAKKHKISRYAHSALVDVCAIKKPQFGQHVPEWTYPTGPTNTLLHAFMESCMGIVNTANKISREKKKEELTERIKETSSVNEKTTVAKTPNAQPIKIATVKVGVVSFEVPVTNKKIHLTIANQAIEITL